MADPIVVIGASLAGGRAAESLRESGYDGPVVLIGAEPDRPYERPPLSKDVLRGEAADETVFLRDEAWYDENEIDLRTGVRAEALDPAGTVALSSGEELRFSKCLLATGGRPRRLDLPGADLEGVEYLRTLRDSFRLRDRLRAKPRLVVVGAGFIGAEVAASARQMGCEVTMLEILEVPLARVLGPELGRAYADIHRDHGVDLRLGEGVERIEGDGSLEAVVGSSGTRYPCDAVVIGVGIVPAVELAQQAGLECGNGIVVDEHCRTSAENVFAAGDVANRPDTYSGTRIRVEHFQNAQNSGRAAGANMIGRDEPFQEVPWFWSDQYDVNLQMLGHPEGAPVIRGSVTEREFTALYVRGPTVVAAVAMNRPKDIAAARRLIERGVEVDISRLGDEDVSLRELLKS